MSLGIIMLLLGVVGYIFDLIEKEKRQNRQHKKSPNPKKQPKHTELIDSVTKKVLNTAFGGTFNNGFDTTPQQENTTVKRNADKQNVVHDMSAYEEEFYEDEENFETELTTPMSMAVDEDPLYSDSEWEKMAQEQSEIKVVKANQMAPRKKRETLQRAYIYSEVFGKPKGLE